MTSKPDGLVVSGEAEKAIVEYLENEFGDPGIDPTADIFALGYVNSLFALELVVFVERTFGITVGTEDLDLGNFRSVEAMVRLVRRRRAETGPDR
jgi:methoxymalonate biosynthesis acyl carrier protein